MEKIQKFAPYVLSIFIAFVFIQSLFFKYSGAPETQYIFSTLDVWATNSFGLSGLFVGGIFDAKVIATAELIASIMLLVGVFKGNDTLHGLGALLSLGVISGAIVFHLFTPLGIEVQGDGGTLFGMAVGVFVSSFIILLMRKDDVLSLVNR